MLMLFEGSPGQWKRIQHEAAKLESDGVKLW